jgi:asparagine synthase (glutamine-hydrolysing)
MCGIAGILSFNRQALPFGNIQMMTNAMRHRGPDDEGIVFFESDSERAHIFGGSDTPEGVFLSSEPFHPIERFAGKTPENTILAFGHRRLSIIDLSAAGHQPMFTEDGRYCIVHNGEIYNYLDIREELIKNGYSFKSNTDTEVILKAYRAWGPDCLARFNGMWAFAIWDNQNKTLFCSRDRIGIKPFYYCLKDNCFIFASDIKTLIASKLYAPEPNWEGVYHAMSFQCAPRPLTCYKGVLALEQSHYMIISLNKSIKNYRFWSLPIGQVDDSRSEESWLTELDHTLSNAVKRRLISDVPVGTFMSGGIDSTTISAMAAKEHSGIKALTLAYEDSSPEMDELPQAKATAAMWPMEHISEKVVAEKSLSNLEKITRCYEEPFFTLGPTYIISKLAKQNNLTVVLSGLGPDELFCGYRRERLIGLWYFARRLFKRVGFFDQLSNKYAKTLQLMRCRDIIDFYIHKFSAFSEIEKKHLFTLSDAKQWNSYETFKSLYKLERLTFSNPIDFLCYMEVINYLGNHHLYRSDQFTMHWSLESRFPYLDHEFVELSFHIPHKFKVMNNSGKYILRNLARKYIHPTCIKNPKKGFAMPVANWMYGEMKFLIDEKLNKLKERKIFDNQKIDLLKDRFYSHRDSYHKIFFLFSVELWMESLID